MGCIIALGGLLSLVVTIGCAIAAPISPARWGSRINDAPWLAFSHESGFGRDVYQLSASHIVWPAERDWSQMRSAVLPEWVEPGLDFTSRAHVICIGAGWPATAFSARLENLNAFNRTTNALVAGGEWKGALVLRRAGVIASVGDRVIPLKVIPRGLIINIAFWSGVVAACALAGWLSRRAVWRWRHRCPACGYDLRGHMVGQVSDLSGFLRLSEPQGTPGPPARRAGETGHGSESRATTGCPECGWHRTPRDASQI